MIGSSSTDARVIGIELFELVDIVAETAGNVHHKRRVGINAGEERLLDGVDRGVHPRQAALPVATH